jgi:hypothetical protein
LGKVHKWIRVKEVENIKWGIYAICKLEESLRILALGKDFGLNFLAMKNGGFWSRFCGF